MDRSSQKHFLIIKTGINKYRSLTFTIMALLIIWCIFSFVFHRHLIEALILILLIMLFFIMTLLMDKIINFLKLPTNELIVNETGIIYRTKKKDYIYKHGEYSCEFHSFFEDFDSLPLMELKSNDEVIYIYITKNQYKHLIEYLGEITRNQI